MMLGLECNTRKEFAYQLELLKDYALYLKNGIWAVYDTLSDLVNQRYEFFEIKIRNNILTPKQLEECLLLCDHYGLYEGTVIIIKRLNELNVPPAQHRFELGDS